jgi:hypothetical protein
MGFGLVTRFTAHFDTASDYALRLIMTHTYTSVHSDVSTAVARYRRPTADVPLPLGSRTVHDLSYQLLTATAHKN